MPKAKNVTMIPATLNLHTGTPKSANVKRRVAGYARVSTDSDEQFTSYTAQVDYYTRYIQSKPDWEFVKVYTDEGITATNTKKRDGFNQMVADALAGKIDLIVTKSVSRFARNTVDSLTTVRKLKEKGEALELDENDNIKGWEDKLSGLKTQFPTFFESAGTNKMKVLGDNRLPEGDGNRNVEPDNLAEALRMQYENK